MVSEQHEPAKVLESVDTDSPSEARREVIEVFRDAAGADAGLFCKYGTGEDGRYYPAIVAVGGETILEKFGEASSADPRELRRLDPENPPEESFGSFDSARYAEGSSDSTGRPAAFFGEIPNPTKNGHVARALLYDDGEFLGWIAVVRTADRPFSEETLTKLDGLVDRAVEIFSRAESRERALLGKRPARVLLQPETLEVGCATENGVEWLTDEREEKLVEAIRSLSGDVDWPARLNVDGFRVWLDEMKGTLGCRYLATVESPEMPRLSMESVLTPRQWEVVSYAAAGATNREIAETLGISADTVSDHLSAAYRRLGVANRVELARKFADSP